MIEWWSAPQGAGGNFSSLPMTKVKHRQKRFLFPHVMPGVHVITAWWQLASPHRSWMTSDNVFFFSCIGIVVPGNTVALWSLGVVRENWQLLSSSSWNHGEILVPSALHSSWPLTSKALISKHIQFIWTAWIVSLEEQVLESSLCLLVDLADELSHELW